jgi:hypothetical protein
MDSSYVPSGLGDTPRFEFLLAAFYLIPSDRVVGLMWAYLGKEMMRRSLFFTTLRLPLDEANPAAYAQQMATGRLIGEIKAAISERRYEIDVEESRLSRKTNPLKATIGEAQLAAMPIVDLNDLLEITDRPFSPFIAYKPAADLTHDPIKKAAQLSASRSSKQFDSKEASGLPTSEQPQQATETMNQKNQSALLQGRDDSSITATLPLNDENEREPSKPQAQALNSAIAVSQEAEASEGDRAHRHYRKRFLALIFLLGSLLVGWMLAGWMLSEYAVSVEEVGERVDNLERIIHRHNPRPPAPTVNSIAKICMRREVKDKDQEGVRFRASPINGAVIGFLKPSTPMEFIREEKALNTEGNEETWVKMKGLVKGASGNAEKQTEGWTKKDLVNCDKNSPE